MVEQATVNRQVVGSSPTCGASFVSAHRGGPFFVSNHSERAYAT